MTTLYIAGPMRHRVRHNYDAFDLAANQLKALGYNVVNPADIGRHYGIDETAECPVDTVKQLLLMDLEALAECDGIFLLAGWESSRGVAVEIAFAKCFDIPVYERLTELVAA